MSKEAENRETEKFLPGVKEQQARVRAKAQLMVRAARRLHRAWTRTNRTSHLMEELAALVLPLFCLAVYFQERRGERFV